MEKIFHAQFSAPFQLIYHLSMQSTIFLTAILVPMRRKEPWFHPPDKVSTHDKPSTATDSLLLHHRVKKLPPPLDARISMAAESSHLC
jgi:hypothetical protein